MSTPKFLLNIDWSELRNQKRFLLNMESNVNGEDLGNLEGIINLIDAIQDYAVDDMGINANDVFDFEQEEERESTGIKTTDGTILKVGDIIKQVWTCTNCGSDNVQVKTWIGLNDNLVSDGSSSDEFWCEDCQEHHSVDLKTIPVSKKIIGFQVEGFDGVGNHIIHPKMDASFCVYSLSQAREMLSGEFQTGGYDDWKLLTIWEGDIEEPTMMFKGNPRD